MAARSLEIRLEILPVWDALMEYEVRVEILA